MPIEFTPVIGNWLSASPSSALNCKDGGNRNRIGHDENASKAGCSAGSNAEHYGAGTLLRTYTVGLPRSIPRAVQNVVAGILTGIVTTSIAVIVKVGRVGFSRKFPFIRFWLVVPE
jgi:hypothetical protein